MADPYDIKHYNTTSQQSKLMLWMVVSVASAFTEISANKGWHDTECDHMHHAHSEQHRQQQQQHRIVPTETHIVTSIKDPYQKISESS